MQPAFYFSSSNFLILSNIKTFRFNVSKDTEIMIAIEKL